ncbi:MAG: DNA-directed DNA polymerase I [Candidatus Asgardarchaeia archaeon]
MREQCRLTEFFSKENVYEGSITQEKKKTLTLGVEVGDSNDVPPSILLDVVYDGEKGCAVLKFYDPLKNKINFWYDKTGHKPYCLTDLGEDEVRKIKDVVEHPKFLRLEKVYKHDLLSDSKREMVKIVMEDPLAVGRGTSNYKAIRDILDVWEANIPYRRCYIMDRELIPGMKYEVKGGEVKPILPKVDEEVLNHYSELLLEEGGYKNVMESYLPLFLDPIPDIKRTSLDIEVKSPKDVVPDPEKAEYKVIAVAFSSNYGMEEIHILSEETSNDIFDMDHVKVYLHRSESDLLRSVFERLWNLPILITFNGDNFDLRYLYNRARRLGFPEHEIPIIVKKDLSELKYGIHIDLYPFFHNRSVSIYAFNNVYDETNLDTIAKSLLGKGKIKLNNEISKLELKELAIYCYNDAKITLELTRFNDNLTMRLIILFMRISKLPISDVIRSSISQWITNLMYYEHRKRGYLIPRKEDINRIKGVLYTKAIIKGKKYKGAIVVRPSAGIHFNVTVLDFSSLYPSVIKRWNLSYETVRCPHEECKRNLIPDTPHWVCTKRRGIASTLVGFFRDVRVKIFKKMAKDKDLSEHERKWYQTLSQAMKVFINATYGVFGSEHFALYCPPVAESTATLGRHIMLKTISKAEEMNLKVIYGDTDSIFLENPKDEDIEALKTWSKRELNVELEVDKKYRWVALSGRKKNYLGVFEDGSLDVKGLLGKKRNTPEFCKRAFYEITKILKDVKNSEEFEDAKKKIFQIVRKNYSMLERGEFDLKDLAIKVQITKPLSLYTKTTPQHVKAARLLESKNKRVEVGQIINFIKTVTKPGVKPVELASKREVDVNKYKEYLKSTLEQILDALNINFEEISTPPLEKWF